VSAIADRDRWLASDPVSKDLRTHTYARAGAYIDKTTGGAQHYFLRA
jgi:hypothetical protein